MKDVTSDPRQQVILAAAWKAFAAYGFRKTSMDDIARGADMSRPALYLHYRNKEDIFRHLAQAHYDQAVASVAGALAAPGPVGERLAAAFVAQGGAVAETMLRSPHGMELMDAGSATASDIVETGEARLRGVYANWLSQQAQAGRVRFTGEVTEVAATMAAALKGIKAAGGDYPVYLARISQLAALLGAGLETGR